MSFKLFVFKIVLHYTTWIDLDQSRENDDLCIKPTKRFKRAVQVANVIFMCHFFLIQATTAAAIDEKKVGQSIAMSQSSRGQAISHAPFTILDGTCWEKFCIFRMNIHMF